MKIPVIRAGHDIPTNIPVTARMEGTGMVEEALGETSRQFQNLAMQISKQDAEIKARFREADNLLTINSKKSELAFHYQKLDEDLDRDKSLDPADRLNVFMKLASEKKAEIIKGIPDDVLRKRVELELNRNTLIAGLDQGKKGREQKEQTITAEAEAQMLELANKGDVKEAKKVSQKLVDLGIKNESWKNVQDNKIEEVAEKSTISLKLGSKNPAMVKSLITELDKGDYKKINPLERANYKVAAENNLSVLEEKEKKKAEENKITDVISELKNSYRISAGGYDYSAMLKNLSNIDYQKRNGIKAEEAHKVETILKSEMQLTYDSIQQDYLKKLKEGTLTDEEVLSSSLPATGLMQGDKEWFLRKIEERKNLITNAGFLHSNPKVNAETTIGIIKNPEKWNKDKIFNLVGKADKNGTPMGLGIDHALRLWKLHESIIKPEKSDIPKRYMATQQALARLEEYRKAYMFITPEGDEVSQKDAVENDQMHYLTQIELMDRIERGEDPYLALAEVMKGYTEGKAKGFWNKVFNFFSPSSPSQMMNKPDSPPSGNKEGRYDINGVIWNWTKEKGWYR